MILIGLNISLAANAMEVTRSSAHQHFNNVLKTDNMDNKKVCSKCKENKAINEFYFRDKKPLAYCKVCAGKMAQDYRRTKIGLIKQMYLVQVRSSKHRNQQLPSYTKDDFIVRVLSDKKFNVLYNNWVESNYNVSLTPSVDRKKNNVSYTFNNIQLMTWAENKQKGHDDMRKCELIHGTNPQRAIVQLTKDGDFVAEFKSISQAARITNIAKGGIIDVCRRRITKRDGKEYLSKSYKGYKWKYKEVSDV